MFSIVLLYSQHPPGILNFDFIGYISISKDDNMQYFIPPDYPDISKVFDFPIDTTKNVLQWKYYNKNQIINSIKIIDEDTISVDYQNGDVGKGVFWEFTMQASKIEYDENIGVKSYKFSFINDKKEAINFNIISLDQRIGYLIQSLQAMDINFDYYAIYIINMENIELPVIDNEDLRYKDLRDLF